MNASIISCVSRIVALCSLYPAQSCSPRRVVSCVNHARVPYARPLIKLLSVFVVVGRRYFSTASPSFLSLARIPGATRRPRSSRDSILFLRRFSSLIFFSYIFHIILPHLFFCFSRTAEMFDRLINAFDTFFLLILICFSP